MSHGRWRPTMWRSVGGLGETEWFRGDHQPGRRDWTMRHFGHGAGFPPCRPASPLARGVATGLDVILSVLKLNPCGPPMTGASA